MHVSMFIFSHKLHQKKEIIYEKKHRQNCFELVIVFSEVLYGG